MIPIRRALISVTDKTGVADFARALREMGVEIISTGGTARVIREAGVEVIDVSEVTGFPEMLDGRVKTLHPKIHGGLLYLRDKEDHVRQIQEQGIKPIDLVAVNLYAFEKTVASGADLDTAIENIDIGGPTLLRAAAKNFRYVTVIVDPADYERVLAEMREHGGATTLRTRFELARKVFETTARYDRAIADYLSRVPPPEET
ncbi:MAG TPA: IMP cyclohydrolase [Thermosulfurimonas dismutans]|uniref:IMP cyclohydrolase n=1 Tax=Thermosulfurimonas dismutans TaxID=999894 RepID=A0A7C3CFA9_9BACT|nr:IMP cyclohydrolase [Thermosulfurimonas dismutans]